jgi:hypothetical protein
MRRLVRGLATLATGLSAFAPAAPAQELLAFRDTGPRTVFFNDYFLFSAERDVLSMTMGERLALQKLLETCTDSLAASETRQLRCDLAGVQYSLDYRGSRAIDRLLAAMQFMRSLFKYNRAIGRESEAGIYHRFGVIDAGLADALRLGPPHDFAGE